MGHRIMTLERMKNNPFVYFSENIIGHSNRRCDIQKMYWRHFGDIVPNSNMSIFNGVHYYRTTEYFTPCCAYLDVSIEEEVQ